MYRPISLQLNETPLHRAACKGHTAVCGLLVSKRANVNALTNVSDCVMVNGEKWWIFHDWVIVDVVSLSFICAMGWCVEGWGVGHY